LPAIVVENISKRFNRNTEKNGEENDGNATESEVDEVHRI